MIWWANTCTTYCPLLYEIFAHAIIVQRLHSESTCILPVLPAICGFLCFYWSTDKGIRRGNQMRGFFSSWPLHLSSSLLSLAVWHSSQCVIISWGCKELRLAKIHEVPWCSPGFGCPCQRAIWRSDCHSLWNKLRIIMMLLCYEISMTSTSPMISCLFTSLLSKFGYGKIY
jgi:hypothetical protein